MFNSFLKKIIAKCRFTREIADFFFGGKWTKIVPIRYFSVPRTPLSIDFDFFFIVLFEQENLSILKSNFGTLPTTPIKKPGVYDFYLGYFTWPRINLLTSILYIIFV